MGQNNIFSDTEEFFSFFQIFICLLNIRDKTIYFLTLRIFFFFRFIYVCWKYGTKQYIFLEFERDSFGTACKVGASLLSMLFG